MNPETYVNERLEDQIGWYDGKSQYNQRWFKRLQIVSIIASALIPFLAGYLTEAALILRLVVGVLGLGVTVITAVLGLCKFQENWITYRTTSESLKHEKYLYLAKAAPYDQDDAFTVLVERVESLISKENTAWHKAMKKAPKPEA